MQKPSFKTYAVVLAIILALGSWQCTKKQDNAATTTTTTGTQATPGVTAGQPTTAMLPPQMIGMNLTFQVQMNPVANPAPPPPPLVCNNVWFYIYFPSPFDNANPQVVTISAAGQQFSFTDAPGDPAGATTVPAGQIRTKVVVNNTNPLVQQIVSVTATVNNQQYPGATLRPVQGANPDNTGLGIVTYQDAAGHTAVVTTVDQGITQQ